MAIRSLAVNALRMSELRTGQGRHIEYIAQHWSRMRVPFDRIVLMGPRELHLDNLGAVTPIELHTFGQGYPRSIWEQCALPWRARGAAMLFCPSYSCPLFHPGPMVLANHGIYEAIPTEFSWQERLRTIPL